MAEDGNKVSDEFVLAVREMWQYYLTQEPQRRHGRKVVYPSSSVPRPYLITQKADDDLGTPTDRVVAIWRNVGFTWQTNTTESSSRLQKFHARRAQRNETTGVWSAIDTTPYPADSDEDIYVDHLHGVTMTDQICLVQTIGGLKQWVGGYASHFFQNCYADENIAPGTIGRVGLGTLVFGTAGSEHPIVPALNKTGVTVYDEDACSVLFSDKDQTFTIVLPECPS